MQYTRHGNEWERNVLHASRPLVTDILIAIKKEYYIAKLAGIRIEWGTTQLAWIYCKW